MILIDAIYINNSGGKVLLDYLVDTIEKKNIPVFYLFDKRCQYEYQNVPLDRKIFIKASLFNRLRFYIKNKKKLKIVLCFANMPPLIRLKKAKVFTYFHNVLLLKTPDNYSVKSATRSLIRRLLFFYLKKNTNHWIVQSDFVKRFIHERANITLANIIVYPFFNLDYYDSSKNHIKKNSYLYPSAGSIHKNHLLLLSAWEKLYEEGLKPKLSLTIESSSSELEIEIKRLKSKGLNIINLGQLKIDDLKDVYMESEYLIYPSLNESFGLPLIEAVNYGCKVIAADLPYVHEIICPSSVFDPNDAESVKKVVLASMKSKLPDSQVLVKNKIIEIINLLKQ